MHVHYDVSVTADLLHITSVFVLVIASIYGFTAVYGFIAVTRNLMVTFGDMHWAELIRPKRWAGVRACPPRR